MNDHFNEISRKFLKCIIESSDITAKDATWTCGGKYPKNSTETLREIIKSISVLLFKSFISFGAIFSFRIARGKLFFYFMLLRVYFFSLDKCNWKHSDNFSLILLLRSVTTRPASVIENRRKKKKNSLKISIGWNWKWKNWREFWNKKEKGLNMIFMVRTKKWLVWKELKLFLNVEEKNVVGTWKFITNFIAINSQINLPRWFTSKHHNCPYDLIEIRQVFQSLFFLSCNDRH